MDPIEPPNGSTPAENRAPPQTRLSASPDTGSSAQTPNAHVPPPLRSRRPSIRVLRGSSAQSATPQAIPEDVNPRRQNVSDITNRRRSSSEPQRVRPFGERGATAIPAATRDLAMPPVAEEASSDQARSPVGSPPPPPQNLSKLRRASASAMSSLGLARASTINGPEISAMAANSSNEYENELVNLLDVVDPEISTLTTLTNVQNSLFVPDLGNILNRRPLYSLTPRVPDRAEVEKRERQKKDKETQDAEETGISELLRLQSSRSAAIDEMCFAVLPDGETLAGWSEEDKLELNDHVRHMLHSRRSKFKRSMKGFGQYVRKPLGFLVTLYATLITLFGLAWVLFLIGWINVGGRQLYIINVIDNVLVALFAIVGDGLAPFRAIDTYHMIYIAHYAHLTWRLRREKELPKLQNKNDLPLKRAEDATQDTDIEAAAADKLNEKINPDETQKHHEEYTVLSPKQQERLEHHQKKFSKSHTFYKPHETTTHTAFPLRLLVAIVVLLDFHSLFQIALGATTWGIYYKVRPFALTTVILCCSIACNITAGVLISVGDRKSRKKEVIERMFRQELTQEAMKKVDKRRRKDRERQSVDEARKSTSTGDTRANANAEKRGERGSLDVKRIFS
ncbi:hypothetical protein AJ79_00338 [Helicocarpus griseus UAMH5409]|uniref:Integral membrane protein n=1 Tax=Helicocarpus griseus UAMH5409 TaxID=1447875 RepID=A0A2B7YBU1_9EURO|nr:hypothetical protein AJ79_00338 [Helicocarpus griseus UAMH5409]